MRHILVIASLSAFAVACSSGAKKEEAAAPAAPAPAATKATAKIEGKSKSKTEGTVDFEEVGGKMHITYNITGLKKNSTHGMHIHEKGDCSAADASSAGGHFNPGAHKHGGLTGEHHAGDLGNIKADKKGNAKGSLDVEGISVAGTNAIQNMAVVIHAGKDDMKSQPAGNSGDRIGCGVITAQ